MDFLSSSGPVVVTIQYNAETKQNLHFQIKPLMNLRFSQPVNHHGQTYT